MYITPFMCFLTVYLELSRTINVEVKDSMLDILCSFKMKWHISVLSASVAVDLVSQDAQLVAAVRPVLESWMARRPDKGVSLMQ